MASFDIPASLVTAIREERAILFLGAGASFGATHPKADKVPLGNALRDMICDKFLGGSLKDRPLTAVAAYAAAEVGLLSLQRYVREIFEPFGPSATHVALPTFRWRAIASTNFDLIIEKAYEQSRDAVQTLVKSVKDGDGFDVRMHESDDPVGFYKLHGCIDHITDESIPLILGQEEYASYKANRTNFYGRLRDLAYDNTIIFCGYSISDPHVQQLLFDLTDKRIGRPMYYTVAPKFDPIEARYWAGNQITCIPASLDEFVAELDRKIPVAARRLRRGVTASTLSIASFYKTAKPIESDPLRFYVANDITHIHKAFVPERQDPHRFYKGYDNGFGCMVQNLDVRRNVVDSVLVETALRDDSGRRSGELFLLKGPAGNGKTVALKRVAWDATFEYDAFVLYATGRASFRIDPLREIYSLTGKRIFLFVDRIALYRANIKQLLEEAKSVELPLTIVGAERENEWHIYCDALVPFLVQEFSVEYLSANEIDGMISVLDRHKALGLLQDKTREERIDAFKNRAQSQLLVALHEITLGTPFENIILDEYKRIYPTEAQQLYLEICALHQFGAPVRAGLISRCSGIRFEDFEKKFLKPLAEVVLIERDRHASDLYYRSRHQHVAELVFNQVAPSDEEKYDLLARLISGMNSDYSSDNETFSRLIKGRAIGELFATVDIGRLLYDRAEEQSPEDSFVLHQRAIFEMQHKEGSLERAEVAANRASELSPSTRSIRHTLAEIARRRALLTKDPLLKQSFRRSARNRLASNGARVSDYDVQTKARVAIDELTEMKDNGTLFASDGQMTSAALDLLRDAETAIQQGLSAFPDNPTILAAQADLHLLLKQAPKALSALEKAFKKNPRQDWLAIRLAHRYRDENALDRAVEVMQQCLRDNPTSKLAHLTMAHLLRRTDNNGGAIFEHLQKSFTPGDTHFEGQFWFARELFLNGDIKRALALFSSINERAPGRYRVGTSELASSDGTPTLFRGNVARKEEGYAFVKLVEFADDVFASKADSKNVEWAKLRLGVKITCQVGFCRRGPRAIDIKLHS